MRNPKKHVLLDGFTLIELLVAITIVVILAGISLGGFAFVNRKQAEDKARVQIALLENAIEEYKLDNGSYPVGGSTTELFNLLYNNGVGPSAVSRIYLAELDPLNNKQGWTTSGSTLIRDPFGQEYQYRLGTDVGANNPDFDLQSFGHDKMPNTADDIKNY